MAERYRVGDVVVEREDLVDRLIAGMATAAAVAVANGKWAHEEHRQAAAYRRAVGELLLVWEWLRGCNHEWDDECARCQTMKPLSDAIAALEKPPLGPEMSTDGRIAAGASSVSCWHDEVG